MKKFICFLITLIMSLGMVTASFATAEPVTEDDGHNYIYVDSYEDIDWSTATEKDIFILPNDESGQPNTDGQMNNMTEGSLTRGTRIPTEGWDIAKNGMCTFSGYSNNGPLFTRYYFYGLTKYRVYAKNNLNQKTKAEVRARGGKLLDSFTIPANKTATSILSTSSTDVQFWIEFDYACDVTGNVGTGNKI